jgi:hypothetical protein
MVHGQTWLDYDWAFRQQAAASLAIAGCNHPYTMPIGPVNILLSLQDGGLFQCALQYY